MPSGHGVANQLLLPFFSSVCRVAVDDDGSLYHFDTTTRSPGKEPPKEVIRNLARFPSGFLFYAFLFYSCFRCYFSTGNKYSNFSQVLSSTAYLFYFLKGGGRGGPGVGNPRGAEAHLLNRVRLDAAGRPSTRAASV